MINKSNKDNKLSFLTEKQINDFWNKVNISLKNECWEWTGHLYHNGYGQKRYKLGKKTYTFKVNRLSYYFEHGKIPQGLLICHHCDNKKCCNPSHLYAGTVKQNTRDYIERGTNKINMKIANEIRESAKLGLSIKDISKKYNINTCSISQILRNISWKNYNFTPITKRKITFELASKIRLDYITNDVSQKNLAQKYNFSRATICNIINNKVHNE